MVRLRGSRNKVTLISYVQSLPLHEQHIISSVMHSVSKSLISLDFVWNFDLAWLVSEIRDKVTWLKSGLPYSSKILQFTSIQTRSVSH
jgi:hypothetical protein